MINWPALILQILQLVAGSVILATQDDPTTRQAGSALIFTGIGQSLPQGFTRRKS